MPAGIEGKQTGARCFVRTEKTRCSQVGTHAHFQSATFPGKGVDQSIEPWAAMGDGVWQTATYRKTGLIPVGSNPVVECDQVDLGLFVLSSLGQDT